MFDGAGCEQFAQERNSLHCFCRRCLNQRILQEGVIPGICKAILIGRLNKLRATQSLQIVKNMDAQMATYELQDRFGNMHEKFGAGRSKAVISSLVRTVAQRVNKAKGEVPGLEKSLESPNGSREHIAKVGSC